jgi:hypothetical protein
MCCIWVLGVAPLKLALSTTTVPLSILIQSQHCGVPKLSVLLRLHVPGRLQNFSREGSRFGARQCSMLEICRSWREGVTVPAVRRASSGQFLEELDQPLYGR